ncbi:UDP-glucosyltransferase 29-like [Diospyros lotus]|uniref:UDP-glucosyltransferase 29-like n=1 Tax=Diospyros lotus TaxID=55363 RepID=UPI00224E8D5A|nr:UDP-glucosyltransferase 29-like [Diospyros lotus]
MGSSSSDENPVILMWPWLAHGHISPFLELAKKLSQRNFNIYLCSSPINLTPFRETLLLSHFPSIQLVDVHLPPSPELPPHFHSTKDLPPHLMSALKAAFDASEATFRHLLAVLKPDLVIYDFLQPWVPIAAAEASTKAVVFITCGAATNSFLTHVCKFPDTQFPFPALDFPEDERQYICQFIYETANGITNKDRYLGCIKRSSSLVLIKSSREIEAKYLDYLSVLSGKEVVPVGPLVHVPASKNDDAAIMEWLSKKEPSSTVFVSFGSEYFLSREEIEEIAHGLELSKVNFIWVVRFPGGQRSRVFEVLPEGFQKRVGERGMVLEGWAPQAKILGHSAIGGFVSHCGWSSALEGLVFGVPIVAMPMHLDQPSNARLVAETGCGMEVKREKGKFRREDVAGVIRKVVGRESGKEVTRRVKEMSERLREKGDDDVDATVGKLAHLIGQQ